MAVFECLASANGASVSRNDLFDTVWPRAEVSDDTLTKCIVELRKAFGDSAKNSHVIETIPKMGFRLIPAVEPLEEAPTEATSVPSWLNLKALGVALVLLGVFVYVQIDKQLTPATSTDLITRHSIAVLPFVNMSSDPEQEYFADGLAEELLNLLAQVPALKVVGRTSSFAFKGRNVDLREIGETLGVTQVLEGSVRRSGDQIRITAQLVNVEDGFHIWSEVYERELIEIFAIQDEISSAIWDALEIHLDTVAPKRGLPTTNMEAYALYLKGVTFQSSLANARAMASLKKAIELDPDFADAHYLLAIVYFENPLAGLSTAQRYELARIHSAVAVSLAPGSTKFSLMLELMELHKSRKLSRGEYYRILQSAYTADPSSIQMHLLHGYSLLSLGYFEQALEITEYILARDPLHWVTYTIRGLALRGLGRDQQAHQGLLYGVEQTQIEGLAILHALSWLVAGDEARAEDYLQLNAAIEGGEASQMRTFLDGLINPETRDAFMENVPVEGRAFIFGILEDDRLWPAYAEKGYMPAFLLQYLTTLRSPWLLNHAQYRIWAEATGADDYWLDHGLPDYCDGTFESWVCALPVRSH